MQVLVTGGAGFIGSHIVRALAQRGDAVRVLDNLSSGKQGNLEGVDAELAVGDIRDEGAVRQAMRGMTHVIHLAALASVPRSVEDPISCDQVNVIGTLNVLVAARAADVQRVVYASSSSIYGDAYPGNKHEDLPLYPLSPYGVSKLAAEKYCTSFHFVYGLETVALRYFNVFGPRQDPNSEYAAVIPKFIKALRQGMRPTITGDGEQTRDFTYVANVVRGNLLALEAPRAAGQALNISTGQAQTVNQLARALASLAGHGWPPEYLAPRPGDIVHSCAEIGRAGEVLGYEPQIGFNEGLALTWQWYAEHPEALS
jgi:nucleoside-diphosphate-sugar epimerase